MFRREVLTPVVSVFSSNKTRPRVSQKVTLTEEGKGGSGNDKVTSTLTAHLTPKHATEYTMAKVLCTHVSSFAECRHPI